MGTRRRDLPDGISTGPGRPRTGRALSSAQRKQKQRMNNYREFLDAYYSKGEARNFDKFSISQLLECVRPALKAKSYLMAITLTNEIQRRVSQLAESSKSEQL